MGGCKLLWKAWRRWVSASVLAAGGICVSAVAQPVVPTLHIEDAMELSRIGGRPAFSPDGKRVAFVEKTYGDAFEIDLSTRRVRSLTKDVPHNGVVRIQYLPNGDFLVTAPRAAPGPNTRAHLEMWVLDRTLSRGLQPLGAQVFEGIAVSRRTNTIAWTAIEPELGPLENWHLGFARPTKHYMAEIAYRDGEARLENKREILSPAPRECSFLEPQDFRKNDSELIYSCMAPATGGVVSISVFGSDLRDGRTTAYFRRSGTYAEVEGIAPDEGWAAVECGAQAQGVLPPLDICRLELRAGGEMATLVDGTESGSTWGVSNPVISPDGRWMAFQRSNSADPDIGGGSGVYLIEIPLSKR